MSERQSTTPITEQLNAEDSNEASHQAFEQSGMTYMEWLNNGGYRGYLAKEQGTGQKPEDNNDNQVSEGSNFSQARTEMLSLLENDPDRVADQVVTKNGDSWSYVRDEQGRKHRVGSQYAADLAQSHFMSLPEVEKNELSGSKYNENPAANGSSSELSSLETTTTIDKQTGNDSTQETTSEQDETQVGSTTTDETVTKRTFRDDFRRKAAQRMLPAGLVESLSNRWDAKEATSRPGSRRKKTAAVLASLAFVGFMAGGLSNSSPEEAPQGDTIETTANDESSIPEQRAELTAPNVETITHADITVPEGSNVWNEIEKFVNNGNKLADDSPKLELVDRIVDAMEDKYGELDLVNPGARFEIGDILDANNIDVEEYEELAA